MTAGMERAEARDTKRDTRDTKVCPSCGPKPVSEFYFIKATGRYSGYCRECASAKKRAKRQKVYPASVSHGRDTNGIQTGYKRDTNVAGPAVERDEARDTRRDTNGIQRDTHDANRVLDAFKAHFPQGSIGESTINYWLSMTTVDNILAALEDTSARVKVRFGTAPASYASTVVKSYAKGERSVTKPQRQTFNNQTQELEPVTERDRERWAAIERHLAEHGSPWPDWGDDE